MYLSYRKVNTSKSEIKLIDHTSDKIEESKENIKPNLRTEDETINTNITKEDKDTIKTCLINKPDSVNESLSIHSIKTNPMSKLDEPKKITMEISDDTSNLSGKQSGSSYGPFLGQVNYLFLN